MFSAWVALMNGVLLVLGSLVLHPKDNLESRIVFRVMPMAMGVVSLLSAAMLFGFVVKV